MAHLASSDVIFALLSKRFTITPHDALPDVLVAVRDRNASYHPHAVLREQLPCEEAIGQMTESQFDELVAHTIYAPGAFEAGAQAFRDGVRWYENPNPSGSAAAGLWDKGHTSLRNPE